MTREEWLMHAVPHLAEMLARHHVEVPRTWVSVGWPKGARGRGRAIGQCWQGFRSADSAPHVFISPELSDAGEVLSVLLHELVHAAVEDHTGKGKSVGHKGAFIRAARAVGLVKPWTATTAGPELGAELAVLLVKLGPYPHAALRPLTHGKKPGSRLRLWECECGVKVRVASDNFQATCDLCEGGFARKGGE